MERTTIQVGPYEVNCSILNEGGRAWIIDPGQDAARILRLLIEKRLTPAAILLTHAHFDHIGAVASLQKAFPDLSVYVHPNDVAVITHPRNQLPPDYPAAPLPKNIIGHEELAELTDCTDFEIIETPGHTPGGVCFLFPRLSADSPHPLLFSGDTLFAGSVGRTDLPGGDMATLMASLKRLAVLADDTQVIPGHGSFTTIAAEKRGNPFLQ